MPPACMSGEIRRCRASSINSLYLVVRSASEVLSAPRMTGTMIPSSASTAIPMSIEPDCTTRFPMNFAAAAGFIGNRVVQSGSIDIGIAVEAEDGIMVPVIRGADKTSLADLTTRYNELIELARQRRISPDMQAGGIATV